MVLLETDLLDEDCLAICRGIKQTEGLEVTRVVLATPDPTAPGALPPFDDLLPLPYTLQQFSAAVERATNLVT